MLQITPLQGRVAENIRAEMARRKFGTAKLAETLRLSQRAAIRRYNGEHPYSLNEVEIVAKWLGISEFSLLRGTASTEMRESA